MKIRFILVPNQLKEQRKREREKKPCLAQCRLFATSWGVSENASPLISSPPSCAHQRESVEDPFSSCSHTGFLLANRTHNQTFFTSAPFLIRSSLNLIYLLFFSQNCPCTRICFTRLLLSFLLWIVLLHNEEAFKRTFVFMMSLCYTIHMYEKGSPVCTTFIFFY